MMLCDYREFAGFVVCVRCGNRRARKAVRNCDDNVPAKPQWISSAQRVADIYLLAGRVPLDVTSVAGVPRSGMTPASMLAELLHLDLFMIHEACGLVPIPHGWRLRDGGDHGRLLIVDDTVASGASIGRLSAVSVGRDHLVAAVYVSPEQRKLVQIFGRILPLPHYLEWNLFNSVYGPNIGTDIDGILCPDPDPTWSECKYERYLQNAPMSQRPVRSVLPLIATGRKRRFRKHTEEWLAARGIRWERLVFPEDDWELKHPGEMKARAYGESRATLFVESDPNQAKLIAERTAKRVICPATAEVWN